jgi:hypothetical protein
MKLFAALAGAAVALTISSASAAPPQANVAPCEKAMIGHGVADWREESVVAGPVGVRRGALSQMSRMGKRDLVTKMPILVEGREPETVTVSVPPELRGRVFLYYGSMRDRDGEPTTSFANTRGYDETEFQLCGNKPRTIWPGGLRVRGDGPVRLAVSTETGSYVLHLGRPQVFQPPS